MARAHVKKCHRVVEACVYFFERPCLYAGNLLFFSLMIFDADSKKSILWKRSFVLFTMIKTEKLELPLCVGRCRTEMEIAMLANEDFRGDTARGLSLGKFGSRRALA